MPGLDDQDINIRIKLVNPRPMFITLDNVAKKTAKINENIKKTDKSLKKATQSGKEFLSSFEKGVIVMNQLLELVRKLGIAIRIIAKPLAEAGLFEQFRTTLRNLIGDTEEAESRFRSLVQFAAITPFNVPGIVEAGNRLQALGRFSLSTIRMLGDLAAASGKDVMQAVEAYTNLITGRTGFAIRQFRAMLISTDDWVRDIGKKVLKTGKGATASVTEMLDALPRIIEAKGFAGLMDQQSKTLLGRFSNLEDAWQRFLAGIGDTLLDDAKEGVSGLAETLDHLGNNVNSAVEALKEFWNVIKTIVLPTVALKFFMGLLRGLSLSLFAIRGGFVVADKAAKMFGVTISAANAKLSMFSKGMLKLGAIMKAHPIMTFIIAIQLLRGGLKAFNALMSANVEDQLKANQLAVEGWKQREGDLKSERSSLRNKKEALLDLQAEEERYIEIYQRRVAEGERGVLLQAYKLDVADPTSSERPMLRYKRALEDIKKSVDDLKLSDEEYAEVLQKVRQIYPDLISHTKTDMVDKDELTVAVTGSSDAYSLLQKEIDKVSEALDKNAEALARTIEAQHKATLAVLKFKSVLKGQELGDDIVTLLEKDMIGVNKFFNDISRFFGGKTAEDKVAEAIMKTLLDPLTNAKTKTEFETRLTELREMLVSGVGDLGTAIMDMPNMPTFLAEFVEDVTGQDLRMRLNLQLEELDETIQGGLTNVVESYASGLQAFWDASSSAKISTMREDFVTQISINLERIPDIENKMAYLEGILEDFKNRSVDFQITAPFDKDAYDKEMKRLSLATGGIVDGLFGQVEGDLGDMFDRNQEVLEEGFTMISRSWDLSNDDVLTSLSKAANEQLVLLKQAHADILANAGNAQKNFNTLVTQFRDEFTRVNEEYNIGLLATEKMNDEERYKERTRLYKVFIGNIDDLNSRFIKQVEIPYAGTGINLSKATKLRKDINLVDKKVKQDMASRLLKESKNIETSTEYFGASMQERINMLDSLESKFREYVAVAGDLDETLMDALLKIMATRRATIETENKEFLAKQTIDFLQMFGINPNTIATEMVMLDEAIQEVIDTMSGAEVDMRTPKEDVGIIAGFDRMVKLGRASTDAVLERMGLVENRLNDLAVIREKEIMLVEDLDAQNILLYENEEGRIKDLIEVKKLAFEALLTPIPAKETFRKSRVEVLAMEKDRATEREKLKSDLQMLGLDLIILKKDQAADEYQIEVDKWSNILDVAKTAQQGLINIIGVLTQYSVQQAQKEADAWAEAEQEKIDARLDSVNERIDAEEKVALAYARTRLQEEKMRAEFDARREEEERIAEEQKALVEEEKNARIQAAKKKAWEQNKAIAISNIIISIAEAVAKIHAQLGVPGTIVAPIIAAALSAVQLGAVASQSYPGFEEGGFTGKGNKKKPAGIVHSEEFVVNAEATKKNRSLLEFLNAGKNMAGYIKGGFVNAMDMLARSLRGSGSTLQYAGIGGGTGSADSALLREMQKLNKNMEHYMKHPVAPVISKSVRKAIVKDGISSIRKSSL